MVVDDNDNNITAANPKKFSQKWKKIKYANAKTICYWFELNVTVKHPMSRTSGHSTPSHHITRVIFVVCVYAFCQRRDDSINWITMQMVFSLNEQRWFVIVGFMLLILFWIKITLNCFFSIYLLSFSLRSFRYEWQVKCWCCCRGAKKASSFFWFRVRSL